MLAFWPDIIYPLLDALQPQNIVEVGSESGKMTQRLLELARASGAVVHAVDPEPRFDADAWQRDLGDTFVFHRALSLDTIGELPEMDAVLIDGDHNWYTVHHELLAIERRCEQLGCGLPLMLAHDVSWPYGRRDLYYDPETVPEQYRQPWARAGMSPSQSELLESGGFNSHLCHARVEGGARNGVLTAVEDYVAVAREPIRLVVVPAVFGLAILLPEALAKRKPLLAERVAAWAVPEVERFINRLELARISMLTQLTNS